MVSIHKTKGSCVKYLESESAYSFHNWPKTSCSEPIFLWLMAKYPVSLNQSFAPLLDSIVCVSIRCVPSKKRCMTPAKKSTSQSHVVTLCCCRSCTVRSVYVVPFRHSLRARRAFLILPCSCLSSALQYSSFLQLDCSYASKTSTLFTSRKEETHRILTQNKPHDPYNLALGQPGISGLGHCMRESQYCRATRSEYAQ